MNSIRKKNRLFRLYIHNPNNVIHHNTYKVYRNKLPAVIRASRKMYYTNKLQTVSGNMSATWSILNNILGRGKQTVFTKEISSGNVNSCDPKKIVNILNK